MTKRSGIPEVDQLANVIMDVLEELGGACGIDELLEATRSRFPITAIEPYHPRGWERAFSNAFHWAIVLLMELEEIERLPSDDTSPSGRYQILPVSPPLTSDQLRMRRYEKWEGYLKNIKLSPGGSGAPSFGP